MKQIIRSARKGDVRVGDSPAPTPDAREILVRTAYSLVSAGTERTALEFDEKSLMAKARSRPDLVRKVVDRARREGPAAALRAAMSKLDEARPLGYSSSGVVEAVGSDITAGALRPGMQVACSGANYANHAEWIAVPAALSTVVPAGLALDQACYVTLGAIAMHGVRMSQPALGERAAVIGCGLIGQIGIQLLAASGVSVLALDVNPARVDLAVSGGARRGARIGHDDLDAAVGSFTDGFGVDFVIVCAATDSSEPIELAGSICRDRGRVVSVGATGLNIPRRPFYDKELSFHISRSYGPGRYDPLYEEGGIDYPIGYVRWTEGRNFQAVLELMAHGGLDVARLTTHRFPIGRATDAYDLIKSGKEPFLGVLIEYPQTTTLVERRSAPIEVTNALQRDAVSCVGAGSFARSVLLPAFQTAGARFETIASSGGLSASDLRGRFGFARAAGESEAMADNAATVIVATRHDSHAPIAMAALQRGKNVFVEKPLAIDESELGDLMRVAAASPAILMVGFNRRFAPASITIREAFADCGEPLLMNARVNAGMVPMNHWIQDSAIGGGRIIGEACHFIDWMTSVCGALPVEVYAAAIGGQRADFPNRDQSAITIRFADGSVGTLTYAARGDTRLPKERFEVFAAERSAVLDDFRSAVLYRGGRVTTLWKGAQDKGHGDEVRRFLEAVRGGKPAPIPYPELVSVTRATFAAEESMRNGGAVAVE
jgi:predicted dehydrogenase/threonine dehydrogenase-like Zn-dependent dehydrogenase